MQHIGSGNVNGRRISRLQRVRPDRMHMGGSRPAGVVQFHARGDAVGRQVGQLLGRQVQKLVALPQQEGFAVDALGAGKLRLCSP